MELKTDAEIFSREGVFVWLEFHVTIKRPDGYTKACLLRHSLMNPISVLLTAMSTAVS
jgi:hypothetical protein